MFVCWLGAREWAEARTNGPGAKRPHDACTAFSYFGQGVVCVGVSSGAGCGPVRPELGLDDGHHHVVVQRHLDLFWRCPALQAVVGALAVEPLCDTVKPIAAARRRSSQRSSSVTPPSPSSPCRRRPPSSSQPPGPGRLGRWAGAPGLRSPRRSANPPDALRRLEPRRSP